MNAFDGAAGAIVLGEAGGVTAGDRERLFRGGDVEAEQTATRCCCAERAGRGLHAMPAPGEMGLRGKRDAQQNVGADDHGFQRCAAREPALFGEREHGRHDHLARMRLGGEVRVIEFERVAERAIEEGGLIDGERIAVVDDRRTRGCAQREHGIPVGAAPRRRRTRDLARQLIENQPATLGEHVRRERAVLDGKCGEMPAVGLQVHRYDTSAGMRRGPGPSCASSSCGLRIGQLQSERQPQPIHSPS